MIYLLHIWITSRVKTEQLNIFVLKIYSNWLSAQLIDPAGNTKSWVINRFSLNLLGFRSLNEITWVVGNKVQSCPLNACWS